MKPFAKNLVLVLFIAFMVTGMAMGQSTGEVCLIGMNSSAPDKALIVALVDVSGSLDIFFTDNEWNGSAWVDLNEGIEKYTTPSGGLDAGDVVELDFGNHIATVGTVSNVSGALGLNSSDQFYMYLGTATSPTTFLFAITTYGAWDTNELTNTNLTNGTDALVFPGSTDYNVRYDGTRTGTVSELQDAIADETNNWVKSSSAYTFSTTAFTVSEVPLPITLASFTATAVNGVVELAWETATETNNARFVIYRDGIAIGSVIGAGTTTEPHNYTFTDNTVSRV